MKLRNTRGILLSLAIALTGTPAAYGMSLDTIQGTMFDSSGATQVSNLGEQIGSISYSEPVDGALGDTNDAFNNTGTAFDLYSFTVEQAGLPFVITASSTSFSIAVALYHYDAEQNTLSPLHVMASLQSNGQVQFSGTFNLTGQYLIQIMTGDSNNGAYSLQMSQEIPFPELGGSDSDPFADNDGFGGVDPFSGNDGSGDTDDTGSNDNSNSDDGSDDQNGGNFDDGDFFGEGDNSEF